MPCPECDCLNSGSPSERGGYDFSQPPLKLFCFQFRLCAFQGRWSIPPPACDYLIHVFTNENWATTSQTVAKAATTSKFKLSIDIIKSPMKVNDVPLHETITDHPTSFFFDRRPNLFYFFIAAHFTLPIRRSR